MMWDASQLTDSPNDPVQVSVDFVDSSLEQIRSYLYQYQISL